ncbi:unnamed protein product, partial [Hapterophycus canaliculatus]
AWKRVEELGVGPGAEKALVESIRAKTLEFERERQGYVDVAKRLLTRTPPPAATAGPTGAAGERLDEEDKRDGTAAAATAGAAAAAAGGEGDPRRRRLHLRRPRPGGVSKASDVREAREKQALASEEIRTLQYKKADANVRLQAERLSNLEHGLELGVLRLERLLDRERILELLRLTDPDRTSTTRGADEAVITRGGTVQGNWGRGSEGEGGGDCVSEELIEQLEERVAEAEERVRSEASRVGAAVAGRLEERARREGESRREETLARDEVVRLQTALRDKEERLADTVVSYL